jgi:glycosyltransferase involved in cell wall biosynthesis
MRIGLLVATKNRPKALAKLLDTVDFKVLNEIVIISSGDDITCILEQHPSSEKIKHIHTDSGQANQKIQGIKILNSNLDWVIVSDDDLLFDETFFEQLNQIVLTCDQDVLGIGCKIESVNLPKLGMAKQFFRWLFFIQSGNPGTVNKSGECIFYMHSATAIETAWLNGASIWRREVLDFYNSPLPHCKYAANEDALFSHQISQAGKLIYFPNLKLSYSNPSLTTNITVEIFAYLVYWKIYFALKFEINMLRCLWTILGLTLEFIFSAKSKKKFFAKVSIGVKLGFNILLMLKSKDKKEFILKRMR